MHYRLTAICLMATALTGLPALAQTQQSAPANAHTSTVPEKQAVSKQDFVKNAAIGGMFEIQSSKLALQKSQDQDVQQFANRMISDHTKADNQLKSIANKQNLNVPNSLDEQHKQMLNQLQQANGSDFVDQFKSMQVSAHEQAIDLFQTYAQNGTDNQLKQFAQQTLPILKQHLQMAQNITVAANGQTGQQAGNNNQSGAAAATTTGDNGRTYLTAEQPGTWRASKVVGVGVYNQQGEKIGNINELLFNRDGSVEGVVIGVGGFLGIGERNVAVPYNTLQWSMTPPNRQNGANGNNNAGANNGANATLAGNNGANATLAGNNGANTVGNPGAAPTTAGTGLGNAPTVTGAPNGVAPTAGNTQTASNQPEPASYPDHAILPNASKDQLSKAPQFKYGSSPR